jgi:hypothetical protein
LPLIANQTQNPITTAPHAMPAASITKPTDTLRTSAGANIPPTPDMLRNAQPNPKMAVSGKPKKVANKTFRINRLIAVFSGTI